MSGSPENTAGKSCLISLTNPINCIDIPDPVLVRTQRHPDTWEELQSGDIVVSRSGTIRLVVRPAWKQDTALCLRLRYEEGDLVQNGTLEFEASDQGSSQFNNVLAVYRPEHSKQLELMCKPKFLGRTARENALSLLGFGDLGTFIKTLIKTERDNNIAERPTLCLSVDPETAAINSCGNRHHLELNPKLNLSLVIDCKEDQFGPVVRSFSYEGNYHPDVLQSFAMGCLLANHFASIPIS